MTQVILLDFLINRSGRRLALSFEFAHETEEDLGCF